MKKIILFSFCSLFIQLGFANSLIQYQFSDYPTTIYTGKTAALVIDRTEVKNYRTQLKYSLTEDVNFAGEYVISIWGCGSNCSTYAFVNKRTGQVLKQTIAAETGEHIAQSYANSYLLTTKAQHWHKQDEMPQYVRYFYLLEQGELKKIDQQPISEDDFYTDEQYKQLSEQ